VSNDPYASGKLKGNTYAAKSDVVGPLLVALQGHMADRGLQLIAPVSRAVKRHEVHELIMTDEADAEPGKRVDNIAYLGFFSVEQGGVIVAGDNVYLEEKLIGHLAGFDDTHMPNHQNIVIRAASKLSGVEIGAKLGMTVRFKKE
jgi:hypothetical protein